MAVTILIIDLSAHRLVGFFPWICALFRLHSSISLICVASAPCDCFDAEPTNLLATQQTSTVNAKRAIGTSVSAVTAWSGPGESAAEAVAASAAAADHDDIEASYGYFPSHGISRVGAGSGIEKSSIAAAAASVDAALSDVTRGMPPSASLGLSECHMRNCRQLLGV